MKKKLATLALLIPVASWPMPRSFDGLPATESIFGLKFGSRGVDFTPQLFNAVYPSVQKSFKDYPTTFRFKNSPRYRIESFDFGHEHFEKGEPSYLTFVHEFEAAKDFAQREFGVDFNSASNWNAQESVTAENFKSLSTNGRCLYFTVDDEKLRYVLTFSIDPRRKDGHVYNAGLQIVDLGIQTAIGRGACHVDGTDFRISDPAT